MHNGTKHITSLSTHILHDPPSPFSNSHHRTASYNIAVMLKLPEVEKLRILSWICLPTPSSWSNLMSRGTRIISPPTDTHWTAERTWTDSSVLATNAGSCWVSMLRCRPPSYYWVSVSLRHCFILQRAGFWQRLMCCTGCNPELLVCGRVGNCQLHETKPHPVNWVCTAVFSL